MVVVVLVSAATLAQWDTLVPTEHQARVTYTPLHTWLITRVGRVKDLAGRGAGYTAGGVMTPHGAFEC